MSNDVARPCMQTPTSVFSTTPEFVVCSWSWTVMRNLFSLDLVVDCENTHEDSHDCELWESSWGFSQFTTKAQTCLLSMCFYVAFKSESCDAKQTQLKLTIADGSASRIENLVAPRVNIRDCSFRSSPVFLSQSKRSHGGAVDSNLNFPVFLCSWCRYGTGVVIGSTECLVLCTCIAVTSCTVRWQKPRSLSQPLLIHSRMCLRHHACLTNSPQDAICPQNKKKSPQDCDNCPQDAIMQQ
jgi:hypothetical protein